MFVALRLLNSDLKAKLRSGEGKKSTCVKTVWNIYMRSEFGVLI